MREQDRRNGLASEIGPHARLLARGYHLTALPANRVRTADWLFTAVGSRPAVQLGPAVPLDSDAPELVRPSR